MCGIAGYSGKQSALPILFSMLQRLEYRGYDSAGIAVADRTHIAHWKRKGEVNRLEGLLPKNVPPATLGIAHTRWATHGTPSNRNAHPILDCHEQIAIVHNGIIDNHALLRNSLIAKGHKFKSQTDTEVIAHLLEDLCSQGYTPAEAIIEASSLLEGSFALAALFVNPSPRLMAMKRNNPLVIGIGDAGTFVSSDVPTLHGYAHDIVHLDDGQIVELHKTGFNVLTENSRPQAAVTIVSATTDPFHFGDHPHYMHKEMWEQPSGLAQTLKPFLTSDSGRTHELRSAVAILGRSTAVTITGTGSSYLAGLAARYWFEEFANLPVNLDIASELAYRVTPTRVDTSALFVSQSGETADVLAALKSIQLQKIPTIALTNNSESELQRQADVALVTPMGPEIAVASTKTFTAQLTVFAGLSILIGEARGTLSSADADNLLRDLCLAVDAVQVVLEQEAAISKLATQLAQYEQIFVLGRHIDQAIAQEAALKLREIAYVSAQGYPAAELKHGNLALFAHDTPVLCLLLETQARTRMLANIEEVRARNVPTVLLSIGGEHPASRGVEQGLHLPCQDTRWNAIPGIAALHLLTYHIAVARGCPVDHPRHLAKSSTVQ